MDEAFLVSSTLHSPTKKDIASFRELADYAADYDSVLEFFPERQDFEINGLSSVNNGLYCKI
jgi:hypothetical protein